MRSKMLTEIWDQYQLSKQLVEAIPQGVDSLSVALDTHKQLVLLGTGASYNAADAARDAFIRYRLHIPQLLEASRINAVRNCLNAETIPVLISQSGNSLETRLAVDTLCEAGIPITGVTNNPDSYLAAAATTMLFLSAGEEVSSATKTYAASILLLYLAACRNDAEALAEVRCIPAKLEECLRRSSTTVQPLADTLQNSSVAYIAGVGGLDTTARQGALLLKEKARMHVEGMSIAELRHGTIESIDDGTPVIIACHGADYREACKHARFIRAVTGAYVALLVNAATEVRVPEPAEVDAFYVPNVATPSLCHIGAAVPFELIAEELALRKGLDIDGFRYINKVIVDY